MTDERAIEILNSLKEYYNDKNVDSYVGFDDEDNEALDMGIKALEQQPKSGKWIDIGATHSQCDKCLAVFEIVSANGEANFCPNCGADMRKSEDKG